MNQYKYKCIAKYPGGPEVGYISMPHPSESKLNHYYSHNWFNPEKYPEYWELFKDPIFTTEDNHDVHGNYTLFAVGVTAKCSSRDYWKASECKLKFISPPNIIDYKWFYNKVNADIYIQKNKPQYSKKDMLDFATDAVENFSLNSYLDQPRTVLNAHNNWLLKPKK